MHCPSLCILSRGTQCRLVPLRAVLTLITWLRWYMPVYVPLCNESHPEPTLLTTTKYLSTLVLCYSLEIQRTLKKFSSYRAYNISKKTSIWCITSAFIHELFYESHSQSQRNLEVSGFWNLRAGSLWKTGWEATPARELERMGLASWYFRAVQSPNQEVGSVRNMLGTDLWGPEQGVIFSHKRILAALLGSCWKGESAELKKVGIQGLLRIRECGQIQGGCGQIQESRSGWPRVALKNLTE